MKNNDNLKKLAKEWLLRGQNDIKTVQILYVENGPTDSLVFHSQQAVEKYLKAYLVFNNIHSEFILRKNLKKPWRW